MDKITNEMILQAIKELADQLKNHTEGTNKRFEQIDQRFEQIDQRFEQIEQKIEQMNKQLTDVANGQKILVEELFDNKKEIKRIKTVLNMY
ncbi:hypothetical protein [Thermolongibacillus altinsuensis]|uniref:hypothetical protein n=1 Tax=Thermolongibacillus altinsuensis TaxID=575256 RepID=UPI00242A32D5|nr:hypothetical protein [Thermolongibacillus altinsuensis]GMB08114.1 hypothetical protein B1no1_08240 [Thermolongibacillus altinsuensis]